MSEIERLNTMRLQTIGDRLQRTEYATDPAKLDASEALEIVRALIQTRDAVSALREAQTTPAAPTLPVMLCAHGCVICAPCNFIPESWKPS